VEVEIANPPVEVLTKLDFSKGEVKGHRNLSV
jgi:hypothetical protein